MSSIELGERQRAENMSTRACKRYFQHLEERSCRLSCGSEIPRHHKPKLNKPKGFRLSTSTCSSHTTVLFAFLLGLLQATFLPKTLALKHFVDFSKAGSSSSSSWLHSRGALELRSIRGGATDATEEDEASVKENAMLDAYIEELLSTVNEDDIEAFAANNSFVGEEQQENNTETMVQELSNPLVEDLSPNEMIEDVPEQVDGSPENFTTASSLSSSAVGVPSKKKEEKKRRKGKARQIVRVPKDPSESSKDQGPIKQKLKVENRHTASSSDGSDTEAHSGVDKSNDKDSSSTASNNGTDTDPDGTTAPSSEPVAMSRAARVLEQDLSVRPIIPNPLFRFLLHRGKIGHAIVMVLAMWFEWLAIYFPTLSASLNWTYVHTIPRSIREPKRLRQGRRQPSGPSPAASTAMARTGTSRRKRRELTKKADQVALEQLKVLDSNSRYRFISSAFMSRHKLGPFRGDTEMGQQEVGAGSLILSDESILATDKQIGNSEAIGKTHKRNSKKAGTSKRPKEEDWVIQALTQDRKTGASGSSSKTSRPTISLNLGSGGGLSVGLEFGTDTRDKYRASVLHAVSKPPPPPHSKRSQAGSAKANDAAGGFMGRIRAAAGSSVSRSLLGAYPGDALPVEEAADSHGLTALAERYGYSDVIMEDDTDEDTTSFGSFGDFPVTGKSRQTRRRRKRSKERSTDGLIATQKTRQRKPSQRVRAPMKRINELRPTNKARKRVREGYESSREMTNSRPSSVAPVRSAMAAIPKEISISRDSEKPEKAVPRAALGKLDEMRKTKSKREEQED